MSKVKSLMYMGFSLSNVIGGTATLLGEGTIHTVAAMFGKSVPPGISMRIAQEQFRSAERNFDKAQQEWDK